MSDEIRDLLGVCDSWLERLQTLAWTQLSEDDIAELGQIQTDLREAADAR